MILKLPLLSCYIIHIARNNYNNNGYNNNNSNLLLAQILHPSKTASIMVMLEHMVEARAWKVARGLIEGERCKVSPEQAESVEHIVAGCKVLANTEYLTRHNKGLMIMAIARAKQHQVIGMEIIWYKEKLERGTVIENDKAKLVRDFEFTQRKTTTSRRPDLILEERKKTICVCDMACPQQHNIETKRLEKLTKYRRLAFEMRERRLGTK